MIEQGIYFALGCIVTALLAMSFAPIFWSRALRLTRKRLQLQVPLSMQEILAARDQLRAEFAVERLRIEQAAERVKETKAADMAEIGRLAVASSKHGDEVAALRRIEMAQGREIGLLRREAAEAEAELGSLKKALDDAHASGERHERYAVWADGEHERMRREATEHSETIEASQVRVAALEASLAEAEAAAANRDTRVEDGLRTRLETAMRHAARHETSGLTTRRELDEARGVIRVLEQDAQAARQTLEDAREREKGLYLQRSLQTSKGQDRAGSDRLELLQAENAALQEALVEVHRPGDQRLDLSGDGEMRASIHALGLAVAAMMREPRAEPPIVPAPVATMPSVVEAG